VAKVLTIDWVDTDLPMDTTKGYGSSYLPLSALATSTPGNIVFDTESPEGKPLLVWFFPGNMDSVKLEKLEKKMFNCDDLSVASKFFRCLRIDADQIENAAVRKRYAPKLPTFYLLGPKGKILYKRMGTVRGKSFCSALELAYKHVYGASLRSRITAYNRLLNKMEKVEINMAQVKAQVTTLQGRLLRRDKASTRHKLEQAQAKLAKLKKGLARLDEQRTLLEQPPSKNAVAKR